MSVEVDRLAALDRVTASITALREAEGVIRGMWESRDDAIRQALAAGVPYRALQAETGLSRRRLDQIRRGVRS